MYDKMKNDGFAFPGRSTIARWLGRLDLQPGVCKPLFHFMKAKVDAMSIWEKKSLLMFDEMSIKNGLEYDSRRDLVEGKKLQFLF